LHKRKRSTQAGVYKKRSSIQSGECERGAAIFKLDYALEEQQYSSWSVLKKCSRI
jgi:hypothetical protein